MLKNRKILVTGSSSGIGKAIVQCLLEQGAYIIGLSRNSKKTDQSCENLKLYTVDLSDFRSVAACVKNIRTDNPDFDGLISNAGYGKFGNLENFSSEQIASNILDNLVSHMVITREVLPHFKNQKRGDLIFIGSESALKGGKKGSLYSAAKFGLRGFAQAIREECAKSNIRVGLVNPGMVRSNFFNELDFRPGTQFGDAIEPRDVALMVMSILCARPGTNIDEINMSPQKQRVKFD